MNWFQITSVINTLFSFEQLKVILMFNEMQHLWLFSLDALHAFPVSAT